MESKLLMYWDVYKWPNLYNWVCLCEMIKHTIHELFRNLQAYTHTHKQLLDRWTNGQTWCDYKCQFTCSFQVLADTWGPGEIHCKVFKAEDLETLAADRAKTTSTKSGQWNVKYAKAVYCFIRDKTNHYWFDVCDKYTNYTYFFTFQTSKRNRLIRKVLLNTLWWTSRP